MCSFSFKEVSFLYCCLSTTKECEALYGYLPDSVYGELFRGLAVLEAEDIEGYSLFADSAADLELARQIFDDRIHKCEWATSIGDGFCSALYLLTNESSVMLYIPIPLANDDILENMEE